MSANTSNSIYAILQFPSNDPVVNAAVENFSTSVQYQMNLMPALVNSWQQDDIATANTFGYYQNPANAVCSTANTACSNLLTYETGVTYNDQSISDLMNTVMYTANTMYNFDLNDFKYHTDRMSNIIEPDVHFELPHYQTAIGYGKMVTYITNKTDGVQNNSVMIGCFGSIIAANDLIQKSNTMLYWSNQFKNSISEVPPTQEGEPPTYSSNITLTAANSLYNAIVTANTDMNRYKKQDRDFYTNILMVMNRYNKVSEFNNIGQTETELIMKYIGTDKIKQRLFANTSNTANT